MWRACDVVVFNKPQDKACGIHNASVCAIVNGTRHVSRYAHTDIDPDWSILELDPVEQARLIMELAS